MLGDLVVAKAVVEKCEGRDVENEDDANVEATGTQSPVLGITRWKMKDSMKDKAIGDANEDRLQFHDQQSHSQPTGQY